jgi:hypothetical protein
MTVYNKIKSTGLKVLFPILLSIGASSSASGTDTVQRLCNTKLDYTNSQALIECQKNVSTMNIYPECLRTLTYDKCEDKDYLYTRSDKELKDIFKYYLKRADRELTETTRDGSLSIHDQWKIGRNISLAKDIDKIFKDRAGSTTSLKTPEKYTKILNYTKGIDGRDIDAAHKLEKYLDSQGIHTKVENDYSYEIFLGISALTVVGVMALMKKAQK